MKKLTAWEILLSLILWAIVFLAYLMGYGYFMRLQILDGALFIVGAIVSITLIAGVVIYALRKYRGQLVGPRLYIVAVTLGLIPVAVFCGLGFLNTQLDQSPPVVTQVKVVQLGEAARGGKHQLAVEVWRTRPQPYNILVSAEIYKQCYVGRPLWLTTRAGALGFEWLVDVELNRADKSATNSKTIETEF